MKHYCIAVVCIFRGRVINRIFADKISQMAWNEADFQLKMILSSEFSCAKFLLMIDHPQKLQKLHTTKIAKITYHENHENYIPQKFPTIQYLLLRYSTINLTMHNILITNQLSDAKEIRKYATREACSH